MDLARTAPTGLREGLRAWGSKRLILKRTFVKNFRVGGACFSYDIRFGYSLSISWSGLGFT